MICLSRPVSQAILHHLLPPYHSSNLREHSFHLPDYDTDLFKKSFIVHSLYKFVTTKLLICFYLRFCILPVCYDGTRLGVCVAERDTFAY